LLKGLPYEDRDQEVPMHSEIVIVQPEVVSRTPGSLASGILLLV
jgi:hypothetical protein